MTNATPPTALKVPPGGLPAGAGAATSMRLHDRAQAVQRAPLPNSSRLGPAEGAAAGEAAEGAGEPPPPPRHRAAEHAREAAACSEDADAAARPEGAAAACASGTPTGWCQACQPPRLHLGRCLQGGAAPRASKAGEASQVGRQRRHHQLRPSPGSPHSEARSAGDPWGAAAPAVRRREAGPAAGHLPGQERQIETPGECPPARPRSYWPKQVREYIRAAQRQSNWEWTGSERRPGAAEEDARDPVRPPPNAGRPPEATLPTRRRGLTPMRRPASAGNLRKGRTC